MGTQLEPGLRSSLGSTKEAARAESTLSDGTVVSVEVRGGHASRDLAQQGLFSACAEVARRIDTSSSLETQEAISETGIVGKSEPIRTLFRLLSRIRTSSATVLITGDNGTGKELVARTIHEQSSRAARAFIATNCSAFNDNLLESELFGHRRGSFTGAIADKQGLFDLADDGTFFMDEVGDMSPALQVKLLRVLQEGVFLPVGATEPRKVDVRIIAATNQDLGTMVKQGTFREDLYYRLNVVALHVPTLRERKSDIPLLVQHFLTRLQEREGRMKTLTKGSLDRLVEHDWPGNVRELENELERLWVLSGEDQLIGEDHLSLHIGRGQRIQPVRPSTSVEPMERPTMPASTLPEAIESLEREMITNSLRRARGNKTRAAEILGISRRNLIRKVQAYALEDGRTRRPRGTDRADA